MITIPTTATLYSNILANLQSSLGITNPIVKRTFLIPLAVVLAGVMTLWYKTLGQVQNNIWVDTCDDDTLLRFGFVILGEYPTPAIQARYTVQITATATGTISAGTIWKSDDNSANPGLLFTNDTAVTLSVGTVTFTVRCLTGGVIGNMNIGDTMTLTAPLPNITQQATINTQTVAGVDAETMAHYRMRVIEKIQLVPGSWSAADYRLIGSGVIGVRQIYAYTDLGSSNTVDVYVEGETYGAIPSASTLVVSAVQSAIAPNVPLGVHYVNYTSCNTNIIAITVTMGGFPAFTSAQKTLITTALVDFVNTVRPFIAACDAIQNRNDFISAYNLYPFISGVVPGYGFSSVTFTVDSVAAATYQADLGNIPFANSVTFA